MFRHSSIILIIAVAALCGLGLVMLASTGVWVRGQDEPYHFVIRQSMIGKELDRIAATPNLSRDTTEMITRIREA